ncbi:MAG: NAD(P)H-dependent oxidoreductase [Alphaproteobacteria bacterium]|nr:NAD(P)H-dependent oxidoreductase [Alphaproteobacteria bacterium]
MKLLAFGASNREGSLNRSLAKLAAASAEKHGVAVDFREFGTFDTPLYTHIEPGGAEPEGAQLFARCLAESNGMMIALPEYNWSYPGHLKNLIDWISRARPVPLAGKSCLLLSASTSAVGGIRGLLHFRQPLEALGTFVHPKMFTLANAGNEMDAKGEFKDAAQQKRLDATVADFVTFARNLS